MKARPFAKQVALPRLFWIMIVLVLGTLLARDIFKNNSSRVNPPTLPNLELMSLTGVSLNLNSFVGQPMVVNLWASWCHPCLRELPLFVEMAKKYPSVTFLFVNQKESREGVETFLQEQNLTLEHVLLDTRGQLTTQFDVFGLPSTFFFDAQGNLVNEHTGELSSVQLFNALTDLTRP